MAFQITSPKSIPLGICRTWEEAIAILSRGHESRLANGWAILPPRGNEVYIAGPDHPRAEILMGIAVTRNDFDNAIIPPPTLPHVTLPQKPYEEAVGTVTLPATQEPAAPIINPDSTPRYIDCPEPHIDIEV